MYAQVIDPFFFANEWRSIRDGDPDLQVSRLEYMMLQNLEDENSKAECAIHNSCSSAKPVDVRGTRDERYCMDGTQ
jgi:hypothetical protein